MNKSTSVCSGTMTETNETEGASEESAASNQQNVQTRASKHWKKIKEVSERRPGWKGFSTPPKGEKELSLRARLLEAQKRQRLGKVTISTQTDSVPGKLLKEVNIDIQTDLKSTRDVEILTDGAITLRQEGSGELIMTHSVGQMYDFVMVAEAQTQTATPKATHKFFEDFITKRPLGNRELKLTVKGSDRKLLQQIKEIKKIDKQLNSKDQGGNEIEDTDSDVSDDSLLNEENAYNEYLTQISRKKLSNSSKSSIKDLCHFNLPNDADSCVQILRSQSVEGNTFKNNLLADMNLSNLKLAPPKSSKYGIKKKSIFWNDVQNSAVADLVYEANALLDLFEEIAIALGPEIDLNNIPKKDNSKVTFLSKQWGPVMKESSQMLEYKLRSLQNLPMKKLDIIDPETLEHFI